MGKIINENQLRKVISNKVARFLRETNFEPSQEDWDSVMFDDSREEPALENDEMGAAHDAEVEQAENWWQSLNAGWKRELMADEYYDYYMEGLREWYGYPGVENLSDEEIEEYNDECWKLMSEVDKIKIYKRNKKVQNKIDMAKKSINEAMLHQIIAKNVAKVLKEEFEMEEEGGVDMDAVIEQVKQYALDDEMTVPAKKEKIQSGEYDEAIRTWAERTMAKGQREGHPYATTDECVEHMVNGSSYMRFFYPSGMGGSHHVGEKSRMKNVEIAGLAEAITKKVMKSLENMR